MNKERGVENALTEGADDRLGRGRAAARPGRGKAVGAAPGRGCGRGAAPGRGAPGRGGAGPGPRRGGAAAGRVCAGSPRQGGAAAGRGRAGVAAPAGRGVGVGPRWSVEAGASDRRRQGGDGASGWLSLQIEVNVQAKRS